MDFLRKIQNLPESQRKLILWAVLVLVSLLLFLLWGKIVKRAIEGFEAREIKERFQLPEFPAIEMPEFEFPEISEEELKQLEEELEGIDELQK